MAYPGIAPLIVTGMHRSATSLVASLLHDSGIQMGSRLLEHGKGNPRGFFEDEDFTAFHEKALHDRGRSAFVDATFHFDPTPEETARAQQLIEARTSLAVWGWKDPRTTLFLDFWVSLLPDAAFLLLYRHPIEVLASLLRRLEPMADWAEGLAVWTTYNERLLAFWKDHKSQSVLCHGYAALDDPEAVRRALSEKLGPRFTLVPKAQEARYHPEELRRLSLSSDFVSGLSRLYPAVQGLYERLESKADVPARAPHSEIGSSVDLAPFVKFMAALPPGGETRHARAGLHVLMTCLDSQLVEAASNEARRCLEEYRTGVAWLQEQRTNLLAETQRLAQILAEQRAWIEELERSNARERDGWQRERGSLTTELQRLTSSVEALQAANVVLTQRVDEAQQALSEMRSSTRWRITGPIWRLAEILAPPNSRRAAAIGSSIRKLTGRG